MESLLKERLRVFGGRLGLDASLREYSYVNFPPKPTADFPDDLWQECSLSLLKSEFRDLMKIATSSEASSLPQEIKDEISEQLATYEKHLEDLSDDCSTKNDGAEPIRKDLTNSVSSPVVAKTTYVLKHTIPEKTEAVFNEAISSQPAHNSTDMFATKRGHQSDDIEALTQLTDVR